MSLAAYPVAVGGLAVTYAEASTALETLQTSPGMMVRQPLRRHGSPLASCNYHAAAAPYLEGVRTAQGDPSGRGAAGRPSTKAAFCVALRAVLERARSEATVAVRFAEVISTAAAAFAADHSYAAAIAGAAVTVRRKRHTAGLRDLLRSSSARAVAVCALAEGGPCASLTPCGTGTCVFAAGVLTRVTTQSPAGRARRPARHAGPASFSPDDALAELEQLMPFTLGRPVRDSDSARGEDRAVCIGV